MVTVTGMGHTYRLALQLHTFFADMVTVSRMGLTKRRCRIIGGGYIGIMF